METKISKVFDKFSAVLVKITGTSASFIIAVFVIIAWAITGPLFNYSERWQTVISTATTLVTFLMVFIIQYSQNKHTTAFQLKLNELIAANKFASNRLVSIEDLTSDELKTLKDFYSNLAKLAEEGNDLFSSHSVDKETTKEAVTKSVKKAEDAAEEAKENHSKD